MIESKLQQIDAELKSFGMVGLNQKATSEGIARLKSEAKKRFGARLCSQYLALLERVNGVEWNGFVLYGVDSAFLGDSTGQNHNGLIEKNELWDEVLGEAGAQKAYIIYGDSSISLFACELKSGRFVELDKPSGDEVEAFETFNAMFEKFLTDALM